MKSIRSFVLIFALSAMIPMQIFAQKPEKIRCYDENCVNEVLRDLSSDDEMKVSEAEQKLTALALEAGYTRDSNMVNALKMPMVVFIFENENNSKNAFLISLFPKFCWADDCRELLKLTDNDAVTDDVIRAMADISGSGDYIARYISGHRDNLNHKAALAYAIGKQKIVKMENTLISWLNDADEPTKVEIYKALLVISSNDNTASIIKKGAKKLLKSQAPESRVAGLELIAGLNGDKSMSTLYKALKDKSGDVRVTALNLMKPYVNQDVVKKVMKKCKKGDALVDAINWLGDIKDDSQMEIVINQLSSGNPKLVEASIRAIFKIDNADGINAVKPMFGGDYQEVIKESMIAYEGDYLDVMNAVLQSGNDSQKLGALQIVESRAVPGLNTRVRELTSSNSQEVKDEAYKVLKLVVTPANDEYLKTLLEYCDDKYVADVQLAIKSAMAKATETMKNDFASTLKHVKADKIGRYYKVFAYFGTELCVNKLIDAYKNGPSIAEARNALLLVENEAYKQRINEVLK